MSFNRTLIYLSLLMLTLWHQPCNAQSQSLPADSIERMAARPDFIRASLLYATPGEAVYSATGHSAMRMECPTFGFDYCFTYENRPTSSVVYGFLMGNIKAHFQVRLTSEFIDNFRAQGRGLYSVELNLLPKEKQELWKFFDTEVKKRRDWTYNYLYSNCSSMILYTIQSCLQDEKIVYNDITPWLQGSNRYILQEIFRQSPWGELFWNMVLGIEGEQTGNTDGCMAPKFLFDEMQKATFAGDDGKERKATLTKPECLLKETREDRPSPFSPTVFCLTMLVLAIGVTLYDRFVKHGYSVASRCVDVTFMTIANGIGIIYTYLILFSTQVGTTWNWLFVVFNPIMLILWCCLRKKAAPMKAIYCAATLTLLIMVACTPWLPQLQTSPLAWLFLAFAVRTAAHAATRQLS